MPKRGIYIRLLGRTPVTFNRAPAIEAASEKRCSSVFCGKSHRDPRQPLKTASELLLAGNSESPCSCPMVRGLKIHRLPSAGVKICRAKTNAAAARLRCSNGLRGPLRPPDAGAAPSWRFGGYLFLRVFAFRTVFQVVPSGDISNLKL